MIAITDVVIACNDYYNLRTIRNNLTIIDYNPNEIIYLCFYIGMSLPSNQYDALHI
jgi:hypothetical protein